MRIGILSRNPSLYSTRRLAQAAWTRGHKVRIIDTTAVAVHIGEAGARGETRILSNGALGLPRATRLPPLDAIIPRIGASVTFYGLAVVRQFEAAGLVTAATSTAIANARDKLHSLQLMTEAGLPIPRTAVIAHPEALFAAVHAVGGLPLIVKLIRGTQGHGVALAHDLETVADLLRRARAQQRQAMLQEFVAEAEGRDIRVIVVDGRCVAAMTRSAVPGEFRANMHLGASAVQLEPDGATVDLAVRAAQAHGLAVAGVDLLLANRGPLVLEVNPSPGLQGIETATGIDIAGEILGYIERQVAAQTSGRRVYR